VIHRMKHLSIIGASIPIAVICLSSCEMECVGHSALPGPTTKPVAAKDVIGSWQYFAHVSGWTATLTFSADGTYSQTMVNKSGKIMRCPGGSWTLNNSSVYMRAFTDEDGNTVNIGFWMVESSQSKSGLALYGGLLNTPSVYNEWKQIPTVKRPQGSAGAEVDPGTLIKVPEAARDLVPPNEAPEDGSE
jgi:hypothetical protein